MRILFLVLFLCSCGSGENEKEADPEVAATVTVMPGEVKDLDVVRINPVVSCSDECDADITLLLTGGESFALSGYLPVVTVTENAAAEKCDEKSSINEYGGSVSVQDLKLATKYFIRACLFKKSDATYTPGMIAEFTTESPT